MVGLVGAAPATTVGKELLLTLHTAEALALCHRQPNQLACGVSWAVLVISKTRVVVLATVRARNGLASNSGGIVSGIRVH